MQSLSDFCKLRQQMNSSYQSEHSYSELSPYTHYKELISLDMIIVTLRDIFVSGTYMKEVK